MWVSFAKLERLYNKACSPQHDMSISLGILCSSLSYHVVMLTAVAALTPSPAYPNIYITLDELQLGSKMYIA